MRNPDLIFVDSPAEPGRRLAKLRNGINHIAYSPDGKTIATSDVHMNVQVTRGGETIFSQRFRSKQDKIRPTDRVRGLQFSLDGRLLFVAAADTLRALEVESGDEIWSYTPPRSFGFLVISPICLTSRDGDVAAAFDNGSMAVWSESGIMKSLWHHNDAPRTLEFASEGALLVGTDSFSLTGWNWETRKQTFKMPMPARVYGMAVSRRELVAGTRTLHGIHLWDLAQQKAIGAMPVGFGLPLLAFSPTAPLMAYSERHSVMLCDLEGQIVDQRPVQDAAIVSLAFSRDGQEIAVGCTDNQVRQWRF